MKRQIFLTYRSEPLPRWREAFPMAEVRGYPGEGAAVFAPPVDAVVWLHVQPEDQDLAERLQAALGAAPGCPVVVLSNAPNDDEGLDVLSGGAVGYCHALAVPELLREVAQVVENHGLWVGPDLMHRLVSALCSRIGGASGGGCLAGLSEREQEVARAVACGASNKEVARNLGITERTVKAHLSAIFNKLDVRDRLQLALLVNGPPATPTLH